MVLQKGQVLQDRWKVVDKIGEGGMSTVYLVRDLRLEKYWALKEVVVRFTEKEELLYKSVVAETNLLKSLNYAGIPSIIEIMKMGNSLLIVMDYVDGKSLREVIAETGANPADLVKQSKFGSVDKSNNSMYLKEKYIIRWGISLCKTLRYLHNHEPKIIYRDMKPQNVMLNNQNEIKLLDFGTAVAITEDFNYEKAGNVGTRGFASPEQSRTKPYFDERSDIYALGKTLYYLATGWSPGTVDAKTDKLIPLLPVRAWDKGRSIGLEHIIHKAIEKNPEDRYQTVDEMLYDLEHIDELSPEYKQQMVRRFNTIVTLAGTCLLGLTLGISGLIITKVSSMNNYGTYLESGKVAQNTKDLVTASTFDKGQVEPFIELMNIYKQDSIFSKSEEEEFLSALQPNLTSMQGSSKYGDFAFEVGRMYWFNYSDGGQLRSVAWFDRAVEFKAKNSDLAKAYLEIGKFQQTILASINDLSDDGMYKTYWDSLNSLEKLGSKDDQVQLMLVQSTFDVLESYSSGLQTDGFEYEELSNTLESRIDLLTSLNPSNQRLLDLKNSLVSRIDLVRSKLETAYGKRG